jgi:hypothetical protein
VWVEGLTRKHRREKSTNLPVDLADDGPLLTVCPAERRVEVGEVLPLRDSVEKASGQFKEEEEKAKVREKTRTGGTEIQ